MNFNQTHFTTSADRLAGCPEDSLAEIAFSGRSNVGKSSLINRLLQRKKLARTSSTPGKTQQLNYYWVNGEFYFVDLPGYGFVQGGIGLREKLGRMVRGYVEERKPLRAVLQLIDMRHGPTDLDRMMIDWLKEVNTPFLLVFTKADKLSRNKQGVFFNRLESEGTLAGISFVPFSAVSGQGRDDIEEWIEDTLRGDTD